MDANKLITSMVFCGIALLPAFSVSAQNPLRRFEQNQNTYSSQYRAPTQHRTQPFQAQNQPVLTVQQPVDYQTKPASEVRYATNPERSFSLIQQPARQESVALAGFEEIPKPAANPKTLSSGGSKVLASSVDTGWQDPKRIVDLVMRISLNLVFVLSFAFGIILIAKKVMKHKTQQDSGSRVKKDSLSILQTLKLDAKTSIRLVQWRSNRFLVACDQNGIQSVNPLNASFEQTLKELDDEPINEEKLIRKLMAGLDLERG